MTPPKDEKMKPHRMVGLVTTSGHMWCEICDKWHYVLKGKKRKVVTP